MKNKLILLSSLIPTLVEDLVYATAENFTRFPVYPPFARAYLRPEAALLLQRVGARLAAQGYKLRVYDAYRPLSVQRKFWEICPDPRYVADPKIGSRHNRGMAVDLTIDGLPMPTPFDDFSPKASHAFNDCAPECISNRNRLKNAMEAEGFIPYPHEWWHYDAPGWESYPILDTPFEEL